MDDDNMKSSLHYGQFHGTKRIKHHTIMSKIWTPFFNGTKGCFPHPKDNKHPAHPTSTCSYDIMRIQTKELSILLSVYFHEVLQQLNLYIQTYLNCGRVSSVGRACSL